MLQSWINNAVSYCTRHFRLVIAAGLLLAAASAIYAARHFAIDTDINDLLSSKLPWRQQEIAFHEAFPQTIDLVLVDVGAATPEAATAAARDLQGALAGKPELFRSVGGVLESPFFHRNGLLFLATDQIRHLTGQLISAKPIIGGLASDPSLRGMVQVLSGLLGYAKQGFLSLDGMAPTLNLAADTLEGVAKGGPVQFSWKTLVQGQARPLDLHHFVEVWPVLDHDALEPGGRATAAIRDIANQRGLKAKYGADVTLTGPVIISDNEFAGVHEGIALNSAVTGAIVLIILWLALRSLRLVAAVAVNIGVGLLITAAGGLLMVGALNPISLAFAVLFVGLGADFAIQYTVRYRAERHDLNDLARALYAAAEWVGIPLTLAAGAAAAGFLSFTPTAYSGLAQLGMIAGFGMVIAYLSSLTLLPALIRAVDPPPEPKPLNLPALAPADAFLKRHRVAVIVTTVLVVAAGLPALPRLQFNFNPLALENQKSPALTALFRLGKSVPLSTARVLVPQADADAVAKKLAALPEVATTWTLDSFVPKDQDQKLPVIEAAEKALGPVLRASPRPAPSDEENVAALKQGAQALQDAAGQNSGAGADAARRLADALGKLAQADAAQRARVTDAFVRPLQLDLAAVAESLTAAAGDARVAAARPGARLGHARRPRAHRNLAQGRRQRQRQHQPVRPRRAGAAAGRDRRSHRQHRVGLDHRRSLRRSRGAGVVVDRYPAMDRVAAIHRRPRDADPAPGRRHRHARNLRADWIPAQLRQHHCVAGPARHRRRVQDLLRDGMAAWREQIPAIGADARGVLQHAPHRHRLRQSVAVEPAGHIEHGQALGAVAPLHPDLGGLVPAGAHGRAAPTGRRRRSRPGRCRRRSKAFVKSLGANPERNSSCPDLSLTCSGHPRLCFDSAVKTLMPAT